MLYAHASSSIILFLFVSMHMDSLMLCFAVRDGLKTTSSPWNIIALWFFSFQQWVKKSLSFLSFVKGLNLISILLIML